MKSESFWEAVQILLVVLLIVVVFVGVGFTIQGASQKGQAVSLGSCLSFDDGYKFCHTLWVKNISYVTVYKNDNQTDLLVILSFQTVESHGYSITAAGLSVYVEPSP